MTVFQEPVLFNDADRLRLKRMVADGVLSSERAEGLWRALCRENIRAARRRMVAIGAKRPFFVRRRKHLRDFGVPAMSCVLTTYWNDVR